MASFLRRKTAMLPLLLVLSSTLVVSSATTPLDSFIECFNGRTQSPDLIFSPATSSYETILLSTVRNHRALISKPALVVAATTELHVQAAVACAHTNNIRIRPRSGGHDYEGMSYSALDGKTFITIDISGLRSISFDADRALAWVQAGATIGELYYAVAKNHPTTAFPAGVCHTMGVGGHFSGGGIGVMTRKFGTAADNIVDARLVDPTGRLLDRKTMGEDLFWAIRGGGSAGFGVIVSFKIRLVTVPPVVTTFNVIKTLRQNATKVVAQWQQVAPQLDVNLLIRVVALSSTEGDGTRTIQVIFNSFFLGRREELLEVAHRSFPELGLTAADCSEVSWLESVLFFDNLGGKPVEALLDRKPEPNSSFKAKSDFVEKPIPESGLEKIWRFMMDAEDEWIILILEPFGGRMDEISEDAIAFPHRKGNLYNIQYFMRWMETEKGVTEKHLGWMRSLYALMTPYVSSKPRAAYYNYKDIDLGRNTEGMGTSYMAARVWGTKYFKGNYKRLAKVKGKFDPENFFWNEQSIPPLQAASVEN